MSEMKFQTVKGAEALLLKDADGLNPKVSIPGKFDFSPARWEARQAKEKNGKWSTVEGVATQIVIGEKKIDVCCVPHYQAITDVRGFFAEMEAHEKAEAQRKKEEAEAVKQTEMEAVRSGAQPITLHYFDGEYLSGYMVSGPGGKLLREIGLAKEVEGWGMHVDGAVVETLGKSFSFPRAQELVRPVLEAKAAKKREAEEALAEKFAEAKATGEPVQIARWTEECGDPKEECDMDICTKYAMPDGTTKTARNHTW